MMIFNHQNRSCHAERMSRSPEPFASLKGKLREGEGSARRERPLAARRRDHTLPILVVKTHHRAGVGRDVLGEAVPLPQRHKCRAYAPSRDTYGASLAVTLVTGRPANLGTFYKKPIIRTRLT